MNFALNIVVILCAIVSLFGKHYIIETANQVLLQSKNSKDFKRIIFQNIFNGLHFNQIQTSSRTYDNYRNTMMMMTLKQKSLRYLETIRLMTTVTLPAEERL